MDPTNPVGRPQLHEITSASWSTAHAKRIGFVLRPSAEANRIGISLAFGATPDAPYLPLRMRRRRKMAVHVAVPR